jgi:trehalose 6-phosphate phosphatase
MAPSPQGEPPAARAEWAYFLDVDGSLVDIAETPGAICLDAALLELVARLQRACGGALALVSGRSLADLEARLGGLDVCLAGQHGLEWRDGFGQVHRQATVPAEGEVLRDLLRRRVEPLIARHPGLLLEDKGHSLAIHYRQAPRLAAYIHRLVRGLVAEAGAQWCVQRGKRVVEIRPAGVDKGLALERFMRQAPFAGRRPVFVGDDLTDEHGFEVANRQGGLSIKVGAGRSLARWRLPDAAAVRSWLAGAAR